MNEKPDFSKNANMASTAPAFLSVWDLHSYYGESYIVQGVSFNVHEGEILALLGRNGAGKTSTLRSIARVGEPEVRHGEIWLDHKPGFADALPAHAASRLTPCLGQTPFCLDTPSSIAAIAAGYAASTRYQPPTVKILRGYQFPHGAGKLLIMN